MGPTRVSDKAKVKSGYPQIPLTQTSCTGLWSLSLLLPIWKQPAGMFTNSKEMAEQMSKAGDAVHERVWQLPLYDDFDKDLHSDIADIRNFSGKPLAGAITAAKFIEAFTESHDKWMHLDIAGVAFGDSSYTKMKSASGYGIQLLIQYLKNI